MLSTLITTCLLLFQSQDPQWVKETWEDGTPRLEYEVVEIPGKGMVRDGEFKRWAREGFLEEKGKFRHGERAGRWNTYYPDGKVKSTGKYRDDRMDGTWQFYFAGKKPMSKGEMVDGRRQGRWEYWKEDGSEDVVRTGDYGYHWHTYDNGAARAEGATLDGHVHGEWHYWWPGGNLQAQGEYVRGKKDGPWRFWHWDGSEDRSMIGGEYKEGNRTGTLSESALPMATVRAASAKRNDLFAGVTPSPEVMSLFRKVTGSDRKASQKAFNELVQLGRDAIPTLLQVLNDSTLETKEGNFDGRIAHNAMANIYGGVVQRWLMDDLTEAGVKENQLAVKRWISLWELVKDDEFFWQVDLPRRGRVSQAFLLDPPLVLASSRKPPAIYASRFENHKRVKGFKSIQAGLGWLRENQGEDGGWGSSSYVKREAEDRIPDLNDTGKEYYDVGVTSLALLAFLAEGNTMATGPDRQAVVDGVLWLIRNQSPDGIFNYRILTAQESHLGEGEWRLYTCHECSGHGAKLCGACGFGGRDQDGASCGDCSGILPDCDPCEGHGIVWRPLASSKPGGVGNQYAPVVFGSRVRDLFNQTLATLALCEALATWEDPRLRSAAQRGVQVLLDAQNPYGGWATSLQPDGDNRTAITSWIGCTLMAAHVAGIQVPKHAFDGATEWVKTMTAYDSGRIGSAFGDRGGPGGFPTRLEGTHDRFPVEKSEALTAMGFWFRLLSHGHIFTLRSERKRERELKNNPGKTLKKKRVDIPDPFEDPLFTTHANLIISKPPVWDDEGGSIDLVYWYFGGLVIANWKTKYQKAWRKAAEVALMKTQRPKKDGVALAGSWDPIGAWGSVGGRVYSTALATLTLQSTYQYDL